MQNIQCEPKKYKAHLKSLNVIALDRKYHIHFKWHMKERTHSNRAFHKNIFGGFLGYKNIDQNKDYMVTLT